MPLYRIDKRPFEVDGEILPQNAYQGVLDKVRGAVEGILEDNRPEGKPLRNSILMLFSEFEHAKSFWVIQTNSKFYEVEINPADILHTGDFNKVEELFRNINNSERANQIAQEYWDGVMTDNPKPEIFVDSALVNAVLSNLEVERKNAYAISRGYEARRGVRIIVA